MFINVETVLFEVVSPVGVRVRTHASYWEKIKTIKHSELRYSIEDVRQSINNPDEIYKSIQDSTIALYRKVFGEETLVVVVKHLNGQGFVVTAYQTTKPQKKGELLWRK